MTARTSLTSRLSRENLILAQHLSSAVVEAPRSGFDLGMRQFRTTLLSVSAPLCTDDTSCDGDNPLWHAGWVCEGAPENLVSMRNALATPVREACIAGQQSCATALGARSPAIGPARTSPQRKPATTARKMAATTHCRNSAH